MSDGSLRCVDSVIGSFDELEPNTAMFYFEPSTLPFLNVESADEVEFTFLDRGDNPPLPIVPIDYEVSRFRLEDGEAYYSIRLVSNGIYLNGYGNIIQGDSSPLNITDRYDLP